ncbi:siderophore-interacting protein [Leucobacter soli]|uniref:Siderophore-interacting protein C-terminal domain-containing protein n=1 Tax=Leucobacter soli TaxID=2812850 RepID=A0A916JVZ1_9MICO|nr:siderophore-interacting protein [Leucobacter soli]CAG7609215.1 hypothetical protein LEUCIP111803_01180 [Leucobacter soli]
MNHDDRAQDELIFIDPSYLDCVLAAGDAGDLPVLREWCAQLPPTAYGRVFVECASAEPIELPVPTGVGVTCVAPRPGGPDGSAVVDAVEAWLDEWLRGDPLSGRHIALWAGAQGSPAARDHWSRVESELAEIWAAAAEYRAQSA